MTDDQFWRLAIGGAIAGMVPLLKAKLQTYLATKKAETGRSLAERIGYRLGRIWPRGNSAR